MRGLGRLGRPLSFLLLPLSLVPFALVVPQLVDSHRLFVRGQQADPLPAPAVKLGAAQIERFRPVPAYRGEAVPVLTYHGIGGRGPLAVSRRAFAEQMAALRQMNMRSISIAQYARWQRGDSSGLPDRPVLITFDGGRLDAYRGADRTLQRFAYRATMFVRTRKVASTDPAYLRWKELLAMGRSGRWDVQPQAHAGHRLIAHDAAGNTGAYYAFRRYTRSEGLESFAGYERRVAGDVFRLRETMDDQGIVSHAVAVPYGNYGQQASNDPRIAASTGGLLSRQLGVVLLQDPENDPSYTRPGRPAVRYELNAETTTDQLYVWLRDHSPAAERQVRIERRQAVRARERRAARRSERRRALRLRATRRRAAARRARATQDTTREPRR